MNPFALVSGGQIWRGEAVGVALAVAMMLLVALLRRRGASPLRLPAAMLCVHLALLASLQFDVFTAGAQRAVAFVALLCLLASLGRLAVLLFFDVLLARRGEEHVPKIVRDTAQGGVYLAVFFFTLRASGVEPGSLLTTSALLTAALGLSLQDTLGNLFAGLAIQVQRPFAPGDWVEFDDKAPHIGRVIEVNWRATRLITLDDVEVTVPNGLLAKAPLVNFTRPTRASRRSLYVYASSEVPPHEVHVAITKAIEGSFGVLTTPPPTVVTNRFVPDTGIEYWVRFFTDRFDLRDRIDGEARDRIWYAFRRLGIEHPATQRRVLVEQVSEERRAREAAVWIDRRLRSIRKVSFLATLSDSEMRSLAEECRMRLYGAGEVIIRRGEFGKEFYVIDRGEVELSAMRGESTITLGRLDAGQFFGERGAMTGEARVATVTAVTDLELLVITHESLQRILQKTPAIADTLSRALVDRQRDVERRLLASDSVEPGAEEDETQLLARIRKFFSL